jgi:hypothetical protein
VQQLMEETIDPAVSKALGSGQADVIRRWTALDQAVNEATLQPFYLARVHAVYLLKDRAESSLVKYREFMAEAQAGVATWTQLVPGNSAVAAGRGKATKFDYLLENRGKRYDPNVIDHYVGMLGEQIKHIVEELPLRPSSLSPGMPIIPTYLDASNPLMHSETALYPAEL